MALTFASMEVSQYNDTSSLTFCLNVITIQYTLSCQGLDGDGIKMHGHALT